MSKCIVSDNGAGGVDVTYPVDVMMLEELNALAGEILPQGRAYRIVDADDLPDGERDRWIADFGVSEEEFSISIASPSPNAEQVRAEAERRIADGTTINGLQFRTDDATMIRLRGLLDAFDAGVVPDQGVIYPTEAGDRLKIKDKAAAQAIYDTANLFRSDVLEASATLQAMAKIPADYACDSHWM